MPDLTIKTILPLSIALISSMLIIIGCNSLTGSNDDNGIDSSLQMVPDITEIEGADNVKLTVNRGGDSYFTLDLDRIRENNIIANGQSEGWCIDYNKPIDSDGGVYEGLQLYSSFMTKSWRELNYFLNIVDELRENDPELTYREVQVIIWSLMPNPEFDLQNISNEDLPSRLLSDGERNFSETKVNEILELVMTNYEDFEYEEGSRYAVVIETPFDVQTVITVAE